MNAKALESFAQLLYIRGMVERDQILLEAVRAVRTCQRLHNHQEAIPGTPKGKDRWMIDLYAGGPELREGKVNISDLLARWSKEAAEFRLRSKKYQLYQ